MNMLNVSFTEQDLQAASSNNFDLLPAGVYIAQIIKSEIKQNNSGTGNRLSLTFQIVEGDKTNRMVFQDITLQNSNETAMQIGRQQLAQLCAAIGRTSVGDSSELHNIPMQIRVGIKEDKTGQYEPKNFVKAFSALAGQSNIARPAAPQTAAAPAPKPAGNPAPWARKD